MSTDYRAIMLRIVDGDLTYSKIQHSLGCSSKSVRAAKRVVDDLGLDAAAIANLSDEAVEELFPDNRRGRDEQLAPIPLDEIVERFKRSKSKRGKIKVAWERYRRECVAAGVAPYGQSQFYRIVRQAIVDRGVTWPVDHDPGHTMLVDWSGDKMWVGQPGHPDSLKVSVFVASLPYSGLFFARAYLNERTNNWIQAHVDALEYFGGTTEIIIPDNASTASFRPRKGDSERMICTPYRQFADHYKVGIVPAAPGEPTHKAHVERSVGISQDWLGEFFSDQVFDTLEDLNSAIYDQVEWINRVKTPYRSINGHTRFAEFEEYERHTLQPLPAVAWEPVVWKIVTVRLDCHFQADKHRYSVPYEWAGKKIRVGIGQKTVAAFSEDGRTHIYTHPRNLGRPGSYQSVAQHQPPSTKVAGKLWTRSRYTTWASRTGPNTLKAITIVLDRPKIQSQAFLTCENIMHLATRYSRIQLEEACATVLATQRFVGYRAIKDAITTVHNQSGSIPTQPSSPRELDAPTTAFTQAHLRGGTAFSLPTSQPATTDTLGKDN